MYKIKEINEFGEKRLVGSVDGNEVIVLGFHSERRNTVMMSVCLPSDIEIASEYVNCMKAAFTKYHKIVHSKKIVNKF